MSYRARALRIVALVAVVAVVGIGVLMLSRGPDPTGVVTTPVAGPTPTPRPTSSPTTAEAIEPPAHEGVTVPVDDPASVFVEEDFAELPPVGLDEPADYGNDVTVTLDELERVDGEAAGPGEVAGPAVLVSITLHNASDDDVDLGAVVVDLYSASGALGTPLLGDLRTQPFDGVAASGKSATATYVVRVPDESPQIKVTVSYEAETPAVTFLGEV